MPLHLLLEWWPLLCIPSLGWLARLMIVEFFAYDRALKETRGPREPSMVIEDLFTSQENPAAERARRRALNRLLAVWAGAGLIIILGLIQRSLKP